MIVLRKRIGIKDFDITGLLADKFYLSPGLKKANKDRDYGGSRMFMKEANHKAKKNPGAVKAKEFSNEAKKKYLESNPPHKGDTRAYDLYLMSAMADASALTLLLNFAEIGYFKANINQEGFALSSPSGKVVKIVDRAEFFYLNSSPDIVKGWEKDTVKI